MTEAVQKSPLDPRLGDAMQSLKKDIFRTLHCIKPGIVQSYDPATRTAQIQIAFKRILPDATIQSYPVLVDCPVLTLQGGGGAIQFPIAQGDACLLLFADRNLDAWFTSGFESAPQSNRCHDLSDGIAIVGLNPRSSNLPVGDDNVNIIVPAGKSLVISEGATIEGLGDQFLALKSDVDNVLTFLNQLVLAFQTHTHTCAAPGNQSGPPTVPFVDPPPVIVGTTKLKGS
jgi:hypothetical protein